MGLAPHTVQFSLGVLGKVEKLPTEPEVLCLNTMCGHGMVPFTLIRHLADEVRRGAMTAEEAAVKMARNCYCGVFNTARAIALLEQLVRRLPIEGSIAGN